MDEEKQEGTEQEPTEATSTEPVAEVGENTETETTPEVEATV